MKKKTLCVILILGLLSLTAYAIGAGSIRWVSEDISLIVKVRIFEDVETGVNYITINTNNGAGITPRLNADGTLYVTERR